MFRTASLLACMAIISVSEASDGEEEGSPVLLPDIDVIAMPFDEPLIDDDLKALAEGITHPGITSIEPEPMVEPSFDPQLNSFSEFVQQAAEILQQQLQQDFINAVMGYPPLCARLEPMMEPSVAPQPHPFVEHVLVQQAMAPNAVIQHAQQTHINAGAACGHFPHPGFYQIPPTCQMMDTRLNPMVLPPSVGSNAQGDPEVGHHLYEQSQPPMARALCVPPHQRERRLVDGPIVEAHAAPARSLGSPDRNRSQRRQRGRGRGKRALTQREEVSGDPLKVPGLPPAFIVPPK